MTPIPMQTVLQNTATEVERLTRIATVLDEVVGDLIAEAEPAQRDRFAVLQDVDLLRQSLDCLAVLMRNLARCPDQTGTVLPEKAGSGVYLHDLRMACLAPPPHHGPGTRGDAG